MYHFFVTPQQVRDKAVYINGPDVNHIRNVLRMKEGDALLVSDGEGTDYHCEIAGLSDDEVVLRITEIAESGTEPAVRFYLFQGLPKADKFEYIIQKTVELGVHEVIPVHTERTIVRYDEKKKKAKAERWNKIAESAAKQSHRGIIPEVKPVMSFKEALAYAASLDLLLIPYENYKDMQATRKIIAGVRPGQSIGIFIGPEGGFEQAEVERAIDAGAVPISLGNRILRTETAPLMLLSVLTFQLEN